MDVFLRLHGKQEGSRGARALIALSTYPPPSSPPRRSLFLSLSRLNDDGNSLCTRHLEEAFDDPFAAARALSREAQEPLSGPTRSVLT